ncbi:MAG TPA: hypothetical protein VJ746_00930 [Nitrospira sp.]|nr:hypothetical protein [Nitrospira sp.]
MDIRRAVSEYVLKGSDLFHRLSSGEAEALTDVDLVMLRTQLQVLAVEVSRIQDQKMLRRKDKDREPPP